MFSRCRNGVICCFAKKAKSLSNQIPDMRRLLFILGSENIYMSASPCKKATIIAIPPPIC